MAERRFFGIEGPVESPELNADFESAAVFDKVRVGRRGVYFRDGFRIRFMDYSLLERVFIRVQEVRSRMCCGQATFAYFRLVFVREGKEIADVISEKEKEMDAALAAIAAAAPALAIGVAPKV